MHVHTLLIVDTATIAFTSVSPVATQEAYAIVSTALSTRMGSPHVQHRSITMTPALTNVLLCTNADTGVGALIAAGSHDENGSTAHLHPAYTTVTRLIK